MSSVEDQLKSLENESKALKIAFDRSASTIPVLTFSKQFSTTKNEITLVDAGGYESKVLDPERVIVTFNTESGANTIAKLEISTNNPNLPVVRRIPYNGGAQWSVTADNIGESLNNWSATNYLFTVQSLVNGSLSVTEATS